MKFLCLILKFTIDIVIEKNSKFTKFVLKKLSHTKNSSIKFNHVITENKVICLDCVNKLKWHCLIIKFQHSNIFEKFRFHT